ncbi:MAG: transglutaminase-like cysteine peptidase [Xanthobacteraceae bacterium]
MDRAPAKFFTINAVLAKLDSGKRTTGVQLTATSPAATVASDQPVVTTPGIEGREPFGLFGFRAPDGLLWRKWNALRPEIDHDNRTLVRCREDATSCPPHAAQLMRLIETIRAKSGFAQLDEANRSINAAIRYISDIAQFGVPDRWSSTLATFATAKGDCEDYAIAKYVVLQQAGFPQDHLRIVLVRDRSVRQDHAVLAARLDDHWMILDNRWSRIVNDVEARNLVPLFALNQSGVFMLTAPYASLNILDPDLETLPGADARDDLANWSEGQPPATEPTGAYTETLPLLL